MKTLEVKCKDSDCVCVIKADRFNPELHEVVVKKVVKKVKKAVKKKV